MSAKTRIADTLHKSLVTVLLGITVAGLVDVAFLHRSIMASGKEALAAKELEDLRLLRESDGTSQTMPFPQGTDLRPTQAQR